MKYVVDCSYTSALFLPGESSDDVQRFFLKLGKNETVFAPFLWWYETNNVLNVSMRRKRLSMADASVALRLLDRLRIDVDYSSGIEISNQVLALTQSYGITAYDATYIELAVRKSAHLMSFDADIIAPARAIGLRVN